MNATKNQVSIAVPFLVFVNVQVCLFLLYCCNDLQLFCAADDVASEGYVVAGSDLMAVLFTVCTVSLCIAFKVREVWRVFGKLEHMENSPRHMHLWDYAVLVCVAWLLLLCVALLLYDANDNGGGNNELFFAN